MIDSIIHSAARLLAQLVGEFLFDKIYSQAFTDLGLWVTVRPIAPPVLHTDELSAAYVKSETDMVVG